MNRDSLLLKLSCTEGIGPVIYKKIVENLSDPGDFFKKSTEEISDRTGISPKIICRARSDAGASGKASDIKQSADGAGLRLYLSGGGEYPELLAEIHDPPPVLFSRGELLHENRNSVAVVGTRRASEYGRRAAFRIAAGLAARKITVVSGCASGVDTAAHRGALEAGGRTVAVLGSGHNWPYPRSNAGLIEKISGSGAVLSEFHPDTRPERFNFPMRNRIISGLSLAVVVVEAPYRSGALITAYQALEQGREVMAVPGSIFSEKSRGCVNLIKEGAYPVCGVKDITDILGPQLETGGLTGNENGKGYGQPAGSISEKILEAMEGIPVHVDTIAARTGLGTLELIRGLTELEMADIIVNTGGKKFMRN